MNTFASRQHAGQLARWQCRWRACSIRTLVQRRRQQQRRQPTPRLIQIGILLDEFQKKYSCCEQLNVELYANDKNKGIKTETKRDTLIMDLTRLHMPRPTATIK